MGELSEIVWASHQQALCKGISRLFTDSMGADFDIHLASEKDLSLADSSPLNAHFFILRIFCQTLSNFVRKGMVVYDADITREDIKCFLEFIYRGRTRVETNRLNVLKKTAEKFGFQALVETIDLLRKNQLSTTSADAAFAEHNYISKNKINNEVIIDSADDENFMCADFVELECEDLNSRGDLFNEASENSNISSVDIDLSPPSDTECLSNSSEPVKETTISRNQKMLVNESGKVSRIKVGSNNNSNFFNCPICNKNVNGWFNFKKHLKSHPESKSLLECRSCRFIGSDLKEHMRIEHKKDINDDSAQNMYECEECHFVCVNSWRLKRHKLVKHKPPTIECDQCSYVCHTNAGLKQHKNGVHNDLRCYECEVCGMKFKTNLVLNKHKRTHVGKVACDVCGVQLTEKALRRHINTHKRLKRRDSSEVSASASCEV